jgi:hypothetical protein
VRHEPSRRIVLAGLDVGHDHLSAFVGQKLHCCFADARRAAGDDRDLT